MIQLIFMSVISYLDLQVFSFIQVLISVPVHIFLALNAYIK